MEILFRAEVDNTQLLTIEDTKLLEYIDGEYYAIGYLNSENKIEIKNDKYIYAFKIKERTKSINFPDMLDSQGNKIFASLSASGKGGDLYIEEDNEGYITEDENEINTFVFSPGGTIPYYESYNTKKVIGIQQ